MKKLYSPAVIKEVMAKYGISFHKNLGQNFLIDGNVVRAIVDAAELTPGDVALEIGPGIGTLTQELAERAGQVIAIELDRGLAPVLEENMQEYPNVKVIIGDALQADFDDIINTAAGTAKEYKILGNLPYYITTPLIMHVLERGFNFSVFVLMVQKEVAQRIVAGPGSKEYGILSLAVQYYTVPELVLKVPASVFMPRPEVDSAVLKLVRRQEPAVKVADPALLFRIIRAAFGQRRKTLLNALNNSGIAGSKEELLRIFADLDLDPGRRGETLAMEEYGALANRLTKI